MTTANPNVDDRETDMLASRNNDNLGFPASLILGFYFAGGAIEGIVSRWKK